MGTRTRRSGCYGDCDVTVPRPSQTLRSLRRFAVRAVFLVLLSGLPQLGVALEDGTRSLENHEMRTVWRVLFFDRAQVPAGPSIAPSPLGDRGWTPAPAGARATPTPAAGALPPTRAPSPSGSAAPPGPAKRLMTMLRVRAKAQSSYT